MAMNGKIDKIKGRVKEAAGVLADSDILKQQGKLDQEIGEFKEAAAVEAVRVKEKAERAADAMRVT